MQFSYDDRDGNPVHVVQLTFLKLLSATAKQDFTYTCQNSASWFDSTSGSYQHAVRFRGSNDEELTQAKSPFIKAVYDGCQVSAAAMQVAGQRRSSPNKTSVSVSIALLRSAGARFDKWVN